MQPYQQKKMNQDCRRPQDKILNDDKIILCRLLSSMRFIFIFVSFGYLINNLNKVTVQQYRMFEDLKEMINRQNMNKIRLNQRQLNEKYNQERVLDDSQEYSFEYQVSNRVEAFNKILEEQHSFSYRKREMLQENQILKQKKYRKQIQLLEEKIKINEEMNEQQKTYMIEKHQREINILRSQIQKYELYKKKQVKDQSIISSLKKDNKRLLQIQNDNDSIIQKFIKDISILKKQNIQLTLNCKKIEAEKENIKAEEAPQLKRQLILLQEQIVQLKKIISHDQQRKKQLQTNIHKLRSENDQLYRQMQRKSIALQSQKDNIKQQTRSSLHKLEQQNAELKKRNQIIEQSFIQHLTQTSLNLQNNIKNHLVDKSVKNTTLNLQETPIRARSKGREKQRIRTPSQQQDPQKKSPKKQFRSNDPKIIKLKLKLEQANKKIVQLLCQKAQMNYLYNSNLKVRL